MHEFTILRILFTEQALDWKDWLQKCYSLNMIYLKYIFRQSISPEWTTENDWTVLKIIILVSSYSSAIFLELIKIQKKHFPINIQRPSVSRLTRVIHKLVFKIQKEIQPCIEPAENAGHQKSVNMENNSKFYTPAALMPLESSLIRRG